MNGQDVVVTTYDKAPKIPIDLDARKMFSSGNLEIIQIILHPGEGMGLHTQPMDVVFFILSGSGILELENRNIESMEKSCIFVKAGLKRAWKNSGSDDFCLLVIKDMK